MLFKRLHHYFQSMSDKAYKPRRSPTQNLILQVANGGTALGQPPLKRHAVEPAMIATSCGTGGNSPGLTSSSSSPPNALAALNGYSSATLPILTSLQHQSLPAAPTYYQQGTFNCPACVIYSLVSSVKILATFIVVSLFSRCNRYIHLLLLSVVYFSQTNSVIWLSKLCSSLLASSSCRRVTRKLAIIKPLG